MYESRLANMLEITKITLSVIAIIWVAFEYYGNERQKKIDRAFSFADRYLSSNILPSYKSFNSIIINDKILGYIDENQIKNDEDVKNIRNLFDQELNGNNIDIFTLSEFYVDLSKCLEEDRCDRTIVCSFFANRVDTFVFFHGKKIEHWERTLLLDPQLDSLNGLIKACPQREFEKREQKTTTLMDEVQQLR